MKKINFKKNILFIIAMVLVLVELPISAFASPNPWSPYNEYMKDSIAKRHLRGAWVSTTLNLDWPSAEVRNITDDDERIERTKEELIKILDKSVELNMNAIFLRLALKGMPFTHQM